MDQESSQSPRRSQREKKQAKPFVSVPTIYHKRKRAPIDTEGDALHERTSDDNDEDEDVPSATDDDDVASGDEFATPASKLKLSPVAKKAKAKASQHVKKPRGAPSAMQKAPKADARKPKRKGKAAEVAGGGDDVVFDAAKVFAEAKINGDNRLFNTLLNPSAALQSTAEDFLDSLVQNPEVAQAEIMNCIFRSCGCNDSVDADQVVDYDGVLDALDNFTEVLKQDNSPVYPLTSKLPAFKKFRKSLSELLERLIVSSAELGSLYNTDLMMTLQTWVIAMSSSQIRSFRHTATVIALEVETALCAVAAAVEKEADTVRRQKEGEKKRKAAGKAPSVREKELDTKAKDIRARRTKLTEFIKEFVDGVFVHRYRDLDPTIRAECVKALGRWFKSYPAHFLDSAYLRYVGWVLSDPSTPVRLEAVRALAGGVYAHPQHHASAEQRTVAGVALFTDRFKPRMLEMAGADTDLGVRVAVIHALRLIDAHARTTHAANAPTLLLDDDEREALCLLLFDDEPRVRRAVGEVARGVWADLVDERLAGRNVKAGVPVEARERRYAGVKALCALLVQWNRVLDARDGGANEEQEPEGDTDGGDPRTRRARWLHAVSSSAAAAAAGAVMNAGAGPSKKSRMALAVDALCEETMDAAAGGVSLSAMVRDWEALLDMLVMDHSPALEDEAIRPGRRRRRANGLSVTVELPATVARKEDAVVDEAWRLEEDEESLLLEVFVAVLQRLKAHSGGVSKKGEDDTVMSDVTRALIKGLPRLFMMYQTDEDRIANVLLIPPLLNLGLYVEMRAIPAYAALWDDVKKQFLSHTNMEVLSHAVACIRCFMMEDTPSNSMSGSISLANTNSTKILELEDALSTALRRDAIAGRDELEVASFTEDEVRVLGVVCTRLAVLAGSRNMTAWIEEDEGGKQSSAWDIISALVERGRLGYKEEEHMIDQALNLLNLHIIWKARGLANATEPSQEEIRYRETLRAQRDSLFECLMEYAVGTQSNTADGVKRSAFQILLNLHVLFCQTQVNAVDGRPLPTAALALTLSDEMQYRCAGYIQAEIERYAEEIDAVGPGHPDQQNIEDHQSSEEGQEEQQEGRRDKTGLQETRRVKSAKGKQAARDAHTDRRIPTRARLEQEYMFIGVIATFLRAVRAGVIQVRHGAVLLAHYGRLGPAFDGCAKIIVDMLREEGMYNNNGELVVLVITNAIRESFALVLDRVVHDESHAMALAKLLSSCFIVRGVQLSVVRRLDSQYVVQIHNHLLTWIGRRIASYEASKQKKPRNTAIGFFRVLMLLSGMIDPRDALIVKAHLDQVLAKAKVEALPTSKIWEPLRAYEKKLGSSMKDKTAGRKGRKAKGAQEGGQSATSDESEVDYLLNTEAHAAAPPLHPKPKGTRRSARIAKSDGARTDAEDAGVPAPEAEDTMAETPSPLKSQSRTQPRMAHKSSPRKPRPDSATEPSVEGGSSPASPERLNGVTPVPSPGKKRIRASSESRQSDGSGAGHAEDQVAAARPVIELQIRKRVRH